MRFLLTYLFRWKKQLLVAAGLWVGLCFSLGYRLPWFDRHPSWPEVPYLQPAEFRSVSNPRIVVQWLPDFAQRYGHRFRFPGQKEDSNRTYFSDVYRTNLRDIRYLGRRRTDNELETYFRLFRWTGPNDTGQPSTSRRGIWFAQYGYEYYQLRIGPETGGFKIHAPQYGPDSAPDTLLLDNFYQYSYPRSARDTLFFRYYGLDFQAVVQ
ncbi:hypothetical protein [Hymenobacter sp. B81]|uniref:hypothetical protein n=1 Tax=Hymenobacter sp. B81 TaxID=3344878 RepID=UPI0037DCD741